MPFLEPAQQSSQAADEQTFIEGVDAQTGIDPRVIQAQVDAEGAYAVGGTGGHNYLNLRPYSGDPYSSVSAGGFEQFGSVQDAITATVRRLRQPFAAGIIAAAKAPGATPSSEIQAIAASAWDSGHYTTPGRAPGSSLVNDFVSTYGPNALTGPASANAAVIGSLGSSNPAIGPGVTSAIGGAISSVEGAVSAPIKAFDFLTSWRFAEVLGGFFLLLVGLYLLGRQFGVAPSVPTIVQSGAAALAPEGRVATRVVARRQAATPTRRVSRQGTTRERASAARASLGANEGVPF